MDINDLVKVTARAWSFRILALMHDGVPGRQAALLAASGAGRTAFGQSLQHLIGLELVERNPGHGHPLRPEYRMTTRGAQMAVIAFDVEQAVKRQDEAALLRRMWVLPILTVAKKPCYFGEIKTSLAPITDRALSLSLGNLEGQGWIDRSVDPVIRPARSRYVVAQTGAEISQVLAFA
jgi:DNA-binding HxlR family transcriptional regulator